VSECFKLPESVLVLIHTPDGQVLLLERADVHGYWQSVTGSRDSPDEPLWETARRELMEETGLMATPSTLLDRQEVSTYEIFPHWRHRYAPGVSVNREHVFDFCLPQPIPVALNPREHIGQIWLPWYEAKHRCFSWTNRDALLSLARQKGWLESG
jgi:dihydroneopterin triphosphate pyrophosphatase